MKDTRQTKYYPSYDIYKKANIHMHMLSFWLLFVAFTQKFYCSVIFKVNKQQKSINVDNVCVYLRKLVVAVLLQQWCNNCLLSKMIAVNEHCSIALQNKSLHQWYSGRTLILPGSLECCWFTSWSSNNAKCRISCEKTNDVTRKRTFIRACFISDFDLQNCSFI